jgi:hypothetical protein
MPECNFLFFSHIGYSSIFVPVLLLLIVALFTSLLLFIAAYIFASIAWCRAFSLDLSALLLLLNHREQMLLLIPPHTVVRYIKTTAIRQT